MSGKKILCIIPARGGSKGIPLKNISLINGKPLIAHIIENAKKSKYLDDIFISTDNNQIAEISSLYGGNILKRPKKLSGDKIPLDPVIFHAVTNIERKNKIRYDYVITLQPTCPLISPNTIDYAIETIFHKKYDTIISVVDATHLYWTKKNSKFVPLYESRKNRQYLDKIFKETGGIILSKRGVISSNSRFGENVLLYEIPKQESIDIDSYEDWWIAENLLKRKKIVFRVDGDKNIGLGHVYRTINLARRLSFNHEIYFIMDEEKSLGINKVLEYHFKIITYLDENSLIEKITDINPHIVINDILDTDEKYIRSLKKRGFFVVNFEDMGKGADFADIVINALYEHTNPPKNHFYGYRYICLRDEFFIFPKKTVKRSVDRILITFGGTDPKNLTLKTLQAIEKMDNKDITYHIILGLGYSEKNNVETYVQKLIEKGYKIKLKKNVSMMSREMYEADIVITSNGRTIYEVACVGTPCISIAQNERELLHLFVHHSKSIIYLGLGSTLTIPDLIDSLDKLINSYKLRKEINKSLLKFHFKSGIDNVIDLILFGKGAVK